MEINSNFNTEVFFSGGAGMFIQYHDIVKPVYLYAIIKMIFTGQTFGIPVQIIKDFSIRSIFEWYMNRRYINPLQQLDYLHKANPNDLDQILKQILQDPTIYDIAPVLSINRMFKVYQHQHMSFPIYVYSEVDDANIKRDIRNSLSGVSAKYVSGNLKDALDKCGQNFTYIFSDVELVKKAAELLKGTCSHILLARDFRYNYKDNKKTFKYDLNNLARDNPFVRMGTTLAIDPVDAPNVFLKLSQGGDS